MYSRKRRRQRPLQGSPKVIEQLRHLLANELAAIDQYFIHSRMYEDWGFQRLFARIDHETEEEKGHASMLIRRMLFLEATPDLSQRDGLRVGATVPEMLANDLRLEYDVAAALKVAIALCEAERDYQTREILEVILRDTEEDHAHWLEQQLGLIDKAGSAELPPDPDGHRGDSLMPAPGEWLGPAPVRLALRITKRRHRPGPFSDAVVAHAPDLGPP